MCFCCCCCCCCFFFHCLRMIFFYFFFVVNVASELACYLIYISLCCVWPIGRVTKDGVATSSWNTSSTIISLLIQYIKMRAWQLPCILVEIEYKTAQIVILLLVAMTELKKCCIVSAYLYQVSGPWAVSLLYIKLTLYKITKPNITLPHKNDYFCE